MYYINHFTSKMNGDEIIIVNPNKTLKEFFRKCMYVEAFYYNNLLLILKDHYSKYGKSVSFKSIAFTFRQKRDNNELVNENNEKVTDLSFTSVVPSNIFDTAIMKLEAAFIKFTKGQKEFPNPDHYQNNNGSSGNFTIVGKGDSTFKFDGLNFKFTKCPDNIVLSKGLKYDIKKRKLIKVEIRFNNGKWTANFLFYPTGTDNFKRSHNYPIIKEIAKEKKEQNKTNKQNNSSNNSNKSSKPKSLAPKFRNAPKTNNLESALKKAAS